VLIGECVQAVLAAVHESFVDLRIEAPPSFEIEHQANERILPPWSTVSMAKHDRIVIFEPPSASIDAVTLDQHACRGRANPRPWLPDEKVTITMIEIRGDKVRLGIDSPKWMPVCRGESE